MITFPNAKINIGLRITGNRQDGYHDIETIFYPVGLSDGLEFVISDQKAHKDILNVTGINTGTDPDDNLVIKTIKKLHERNAFPFLKIHLHKVIPGWCRTRRWFIRCSLSVKNYKQMFWPRYH